MFLKVFCGVLVYSFIYLSNFEMVSIEHGILHSFAHYNLIFHRFLQRVFFLNSWLLKFWHVVSTKISLLMYLMCHGPPIHAALVISDIMFRVLLHSFAEAYCVKLTAIKCIEELYFRLIWHFQSLLLWLFLTLIYFLFCFVLIFGVGVSVWPWLFWNLLCRSG